MLTSRVKLISNVQMETQTIRSPLILKDSTQHASSAIAVIYAQLQNNAFCNIIYAKWRIHSVNNNK